MVKGGDSASKAPKGWQSVDIRDMLSTSAKSIGAGSPTDAGRSWRLPTEHPDPIILAAGIPDAPTLPVDDLRDALDEVLTSEPAEALQYGGWSGFEGLRSAIAERQSRIEGVELGPENFIVTNGSSGGIDLIGKAFLEPGDVVVVEGPSFSGTVRSMRGYMAEIVEIPMERDGVSVSGLEEAIQRVEAAGKRVKIFYTIADFHNPTGATLAEGKRLALIELCARHRVLIMEDAAYTELHFDQPVPASIFGTGEGRGVLRLNTFSKTIATGLRVGWVQASPEYIEAMTRVRFDMGGSPLFHRALAPFVSSGKLDTHVDRMRPVYAEKCDVLSRSLLEHCEPYVRFERPDGGFFLWVECIGAPAREVARAAAEEGVVFPVGSVFFTDRENVKDSHVRMAFSNASVEHLAEAGRRLRKAFLRLVD